MVTHALLSATRPFPSMLHSLTHPHPPALPTASAAVRPRDSPRMQRRLARAGPRQLPVLQGARLARSTAADRDVPPRYPGGLLRRPAH